MTDPRLFDTGDQAVDTALTDLAVADSVTANQAEAAFGALTWGQGLQVVSLRSVQEFLWYQLPSKFAVTVQEHLEVAHALGALFDRVGDGPGRRCRTTGGRSSAGRSAALFVLPARSTPAPLVPGRWPRDQ
jgi:hypothetical protein